MREPELLLKRCWAARRVDHADHRLQVDQLECVRGPRRLFQGLSFTVSAGEMLWVQGANGSGKTSLLRMLCGLASPESGAVLWDGRDIRANRDQLHEDLLYAGHAAAVKDDLTARENLRFGLAQSGIHASDAQAHAALAEFGLDTRADVMTRALSQGQKRRVALARLALATAKPLWILDEPFTALDRDASQLVQSHLEAHLQRGAVVVFTSHQDVDFAHSRVTRLRLDA